MTKIERLTTIEAGRLVQAISFNQIEEKTMDFCLMMSITMWAGYVDGKLACMWGVIPPSLMSDQAYLWLYTTDVIKEHQFLLVRHSQMVIEEILKSYSSVVGHATLGAEKSMRWLKWLGAEFGYPSGNLIPFRIRRSA